MPSAITQRQIESGFEKFRTYIERSYIKDYTDNTTLMVNELQSAYRSGSLNKVADTLSRPLIACEEIAALVIEISNDSAHIRTVQQAGQDLKRRTDCFENSHTDPAEMHRWTSKGYLV